MSDSPAGSLTIGAVVANVATGAPDATAAIIAGSRHSFTELDAAGSAIAGRLVASGLGLGDVALVISPTSFDLLATFVGCARTGVVFAPINPELGAAAIGELTSNIGATIALVAPEHGDLATGLAVPTAWPAGDNRYATADAPNQASTSTSTKLGLPAIRGSDPHIAFFTSGSTGTPKAALLTHQTSVLRSHPGSQLEPRGAALCPYPLFHMAGWTIALQQWHARAPVVFVDSTDAPTLATALQEHDIERFNAIPALWSRLSDHVGGSPGAFPHLRFADTGTSPTSSALLDAIVGLAPNAQVRVFYGSSEAGNVTSLHHEDLRRAPGSCGRASVLTSLRIGEDGELLISGPLLFEGYLNDPDATAAAIRDGWFHTGDRAEIDDDGFVRILGRLGTVIRTGGESVTPETVEDAARSHPDIDDVAVFGMPDEQWGEVVWAAVVGSSDVGSSTIDLAELQEHLATEGVARFAKPRHLLSLDAIPRTAATGQTDRRLLRQLAQEQQQ